MLVSIVSIVTPRDIGLFVTYTPTLENVSTGLEYINKMQATYISNAPSNNSPSIALGSYLERKDLGRVQPWNS